MYVCMYMYMYICVYMHVYVYVYLYLCTLSSMALLNVYHINASKYYTAFYAYVFIYCVFIYVFIYFQTFTPHYYNALEHGHDLRHNVVRLPQTKRKYYVQCTKYRFLKLIRDTSQSDLDPSLTSSLTQFIAHFKYFIIESYNPQCTVRNCFVCARQ